MLKDEPALVSSAATNVGGTTLHPTYSLAIAKDPRAPSKLHYASAKPEPHTPSVSFLTPTQPACTMISLPPEQASEPPK